MDACIFIYSRAHCITIQAKRKSHSGTIQGPYVQGYAYLGTIQESETKVVNSGTFPSIRGPLRAMLLIDSPTE